jgi:hypothetical protein
MRQSSPYPPTRRKSHGLQDHGDRALDMNAPVDSVNPARDGAGTARPIVSQVRMIGAVIGEGKLVVLGLEYPPKRHPNSAPSPNILDVEIRAKRVME